MIYLFNFLMGFWCDYHKKSFWCFSLLVILAAFFIWCFSGVGHSGPSLSETIFQWKSIVKLLVFFMGCYIGGIFREVRDDIVANKKKREDMQVKMGKAAMEEDYETFDKLQLKVERFDIFKINPH